MLATVITLLVVLGVAAMLLMNIACTGAFFDSAPTGDRAMGLVVPIFGLGGGIAALTLAALLSGLRVSVCALGVITPSPVLSGALVVVIALGAALAGGMAFILWCEPAAVGRPLRGVTVPVGVLAGVVGPIVLGVMMLVGVWMPRSSAAAALAASEGDGLGLRAGFVAVCVLAFVGYGLGVSMFWREIERRATNRGASLAEALKEHATRQLLDRRSPKQRLIDELAEFSPDAPLWSILAYLPEQPGAKELDDECRAVVVQRALKVSGFDTQLNDCMQGRYSLHRQGAAEFLALAPEPVFAAHREAWGRALVAGLEATGEGIACRPAWLSETFDAKPDPLGHVRSLLKAADRFKDWSGRGEIERALQKMGEDAGMLNADARRKKLLKMLAEAGYQAGTVRPAPGR